MTERIAAHPDGAVLAIRAAPGASRDRVIGWHGDLLKVAVTAPPEKGKANQAIARVLAKALGLPPRNLTLLSGTTSPDKRFLLAGVSVDDLGQRIERLLDGG